jgi:hypothetical protein
MQLRFKHVGSETRAITPALATEFSTMPASVTERELNPKRMDYLKGVILGGSALPFIWARAKVLETGEVYRVNGHHSSTLLASLDGDMPEGLIAHIDNYEVQANMDLAWLFRQFDPRQSARTPGDIAGAYMMSVPELRNVGRLAGQKAILGATWYDKKIVGLSVPTGDDVYTMFAKPVYHDFIHMVDRIYSDKTPEFTAPVLGAAYGTFEKSSTQSEEFWTDVAHQGGNNASDERHPTTVLDAELLNLRAVKKSHQRVVKEMEVYRACAVAWNAFRSGRSLDRIGKWDPKKGAPDLD